jgi:hypothetical protein
MTQKMNPEISIAKPTLVEKRPWENAMNTAWMILIVRSDL